MSDDMFTLEQKIKKCPECGGSKKKPKIIFDIWDEDYIYCYHEFHGKKIVGYNSF